MLVTGAIHPQGENEFVRPAQVDCHLLHAFVVMNRYFHVRIINWIPMLLVSGEKAVWSVFDFEYTAFFFLTV